jgi:hypothetical protein
MARPPADISSRYVRAIPIGVGFPCRPDPLLSRVRKAVEKMTEVLERIARERLASLEQESGALTGETEGFLLFSRENCAFVDFLSFLWKVMIHRLRVGGAPAKCFVSDFL